MATKSDKIWADAIRKQVHEYSEIDDPESKAKKLKYIKVLAAQLIKSASEGDMTAMKEVGDRLDGKPQQSVDMNVETTNYVAKMPGQVGTPEEWQEQHAPKTIQ